VAYPEHFDHLKVNGALPDPLPKKYFRPALTVRIFPGYPRAAAVLSWRASAPLAIAPKSLI
jgi:hypothetical protein